MSSTLKSIALTCVLSTGLLTTPAFAKSWVEDQTTVRSKANVIMDDTIVLRTDTPFKQVRVANADIADVVVLTDQSFHVLGKTRGKTSVMLYDDANSLVDIIEVKVGYDLNTLKQTLHETFPSEKIEVRDLAGSIFLSGDVSNAKIAKRAQTIAQAFAPERVTNNLGIRDSHQVMLQVRFVEASRSAIKELGIGLLTQQAGEFAFQTGTGLLSGGTGALAGSLLQNIDEVQLGLDIQALEDQGVIRILAEPNLVAMSGDTASFLAGGEFPIPIPLDDERVGIEYRQFGVGLAFTPTVLGDGIINLKIAPEVSQLDTANGVNIAGTSVPALRVRRANTTVEMRNDQSFAIAGLLENSSTNNKVQTPWIGDVPIIGSLFRSSSYQRAETELMIIVTPRLVQPVSDISQLSTPLDNAPTTNETNFFLNGELEQNRTSQLGQTRGQTQVPAQGQTKAAGGLSAKYGHTLQ